MTDQVPPALVDQVMVMPAEGDEVSEKWIVTPFAFASWRAPWGDLLVTVGPGRVPPEIAGILTGQPSETGPPSE